MTKHRILSKNKIEEYAYKFLKRNSPESLKKVAPIDIEYIIENKLNIKLQYLKLDENKNLLGMTIMNPMIVEYIDENSKLVKNIFDRNTIIINEFLAVEKSQEHRLNFTLAHEVGHWYLQRDDAYIFSEGEKIISGKGNKYNRFIDNFNLFKNINKKKLKTDEDWFEWQANYFASCILMPRKIFWNEYLKLKNKDILDIRKELSNKFNVSEEAITYRIEDIKKELNIEEEKNV